MPEGHTLHRIAGEVEERLGGRVVRTSSPQGRFGEAAALLDRRTVAGASAHGKHLFLEMDDTRIVHVHLGLIGGFSWSRAPAPEPVGAVRLRMTGPEWTLDLRGPNTCDLLTPDQVSRITEALGADPLRDDADATAAGELIRRSRRPIAVLLMDQAVLSGVGNVFRAELLFRHRLHPYAPGSYLTHALWRAMWDDLVELMREGVRTGRIDTVRPEHEPAAMGREPRVDDHGGEVYVYRRHGQRCHVCRGWVRTEVLAGRNLFWCPRCQRRGRPRS